MCKISSVLADYKVVVACDEKVSLELFVEAAYDLNVTGPKTPYSFDWVMSDFIIDENGLSEGFVLQMTFTS